MLSDAEEMIQWKCTAPVLKNAFFLDSNQNQGELRRSRRSRSGVGVGVGVLLEAKLRYKVYAEIIE